MRKYGLSFISDADLYEHTLNTVRQFRTIITLDDFNKNIVDPIKLTFDAHVYRKPVEEVVEAEVIRQLEKSNENLIGHFHQNIFRYIGKGWEIPEDGFDVVNHSRQIFAEIKNKHNTMNSSSASSNHTKMKGLILGNSKAICYLVEIIAKKSQDIPWKIANAALKPDKQERLRRISIDRFYTVVTNEPFAFRDLCQVIGRVIDDIIKDNPQAIGENTVLAELHKHGKNILKQLFLTSFETYQGFHDFKIQK